MNNMWSTYVQTSEELYNSRAVRFREDNKNLWLSSMRLFDGMKILEVGCGGGLFCNRIKQYLPKCSVIGIDRDTGHIEYAKDKSKELGIDCDFFNGDALELPFDNDTFDACTSHTVIEHIETISFLKEQFRVLKPGGVISVLSVRTGLNISPENFMPTHSEEMTLFNKVWDKEKEFDKDNGVGSYEMKEFDFPKALEKVGFRQVNVEFISITRYAPDNADCSPELAKMQINTNRLHSLESVNKALRIAPNVLTNKEKNRLLDLTNKRFDERIRKYENGEKVWDIETSCIMVVTGYK